MCCILNHLSTIPSSLVLEMRYRPRHWVSHICHVHCTGMTTNHLSCILVFLNLNMDIVCLCNLLQVLAQHRTTCLTDMVEVNPCNGYSCAPGNFPCRITNSGGYLVVRKTSRRKLKRSWSITYSFRGGTKIVVGRRSCSHYRQSP